MPIWGWLIGLVVLYILWRLSNQKPPKRGETAIGAHGYTIPARWKYRSDKVWWTLWFWWILFIFLVGVCTLSAGK